MDQLFFWMILQITNAFQKISGVSNHKPNRIRVDKSSEFYNSSRKSCLAKKTIEMYSAHNVGKSMEKVYEFNIKKCVYWETRSRS